MRARGVTVVMYLYLSVAIVERDFGSVARGLYVTMRISGTIFSRRYASCMSRSVQAHEWNHEAHGQCIVYRDESTVR